MRPNEHGLGGLCGASSPVSEWRLIFVTSIRISVECLSKRSDDGEIVCSGASARRVPSMVGRRRARRVGVHQRCRSSRAWSRNSYLFVTSIRIGVPLRHRHPNYCQRGCRSGCRAPAAARDRLTVTASEDGLARPRGCQLEGRSELDPVAKPGDIPSGSGL